MSAGPLTLGELERFNTDGYLSPLTLCSPEEMARVRAHIDAHVLTKKSRIASCGLRKSRHLDDRVVYDLSTRPAIIDRAASMLGENIVLWRTQFFVKNPGDKMIPWHQDGNFLPLEPMLNLSAWIAIDDADEENACMRFIPGSHRSALPHVEAPADAEFREMADPRGFDESRAVSIQLRAGQFVLFKDRLLHSSRANTSDRRRLGLAVRLTRPSVRIKLHETNPGQYGILVRGQDTSGLNEYLDPPA